MNFTVVNHELSVGNIKIIGIAGSSVFLVGDTEFISLATIFDTPPETLIIGTALVPL